MGDALLDHAFLEGPVAGVPRDVGGSLGMELDAPAPAEDAVVSLHQCREEVPRVRGQWLDRRGARALGCHDADRTRARARPERVPRSIPCPYTAHGCVASSRHNDILWIRQSPSLTPLPWNGQPAIVGVLQPFTPGHALRRTRPGHTAGTLEA